MPAKKKLPTMPKLRAIPISAKQCKVWCPYCATWHIHGYDDLERRRWTHRVAHCYDYSSPFKADGYLIRLVNRHGD